MTVTEFQDFKPDLLLLEGSPQSREPLHRSRRLPWDLEQAFLRNGGAIIFLGASGSFNDAEKNNGFAEYGFPLALSGSQRVGSKWGGFPAFVSPIHGGPVKIEGVSVARSILGSCERLDLIEVAKPFVLDDTAWAAQPVLFAPDGYDVKDPVWRYEGSLGSVRKPYAIAAYKYKGGPILLFTGDLFSDSMITRASNADLFRSTMSVIEKLLGRKRLMATRSETAETGLKPEASQEKAYAWDFFLAYSAKDGAYADRLFADLSKYGRVFLDRCCIKPGDIWIQRLRTEQNRARCTVLLITQHMEEAWYTNSEYVHAIELARAGRHRIVPVLVDRGSKLPYGLEQVHALKHDGTGDFTSVSRQIANVLSQSPELS